MVYVSFPIAAKKVEKSKKTKEMKVDDPIPGPSNTRKSARSRK